jgi:tRNA (adenine37-N6)-methyltransferase
LNPESNLFLKPIGYLRTAQERKFQLPPQPQADTECHGMVELQPGHHYDVALRDLDGFSRVWLLWWFHKNDNWRPTTLPPRGRTGRKGTFATRSPYRPNPLAMSCVELLALETNRLYIGAHDLLADTPILDIKPYIPEFDSFPEAQAGWYDEMKNTITQTDPFQIQFSEAATKTLNTLVNPDLKDKVLSILRADPFPHRTRRIIEFETGYRLSCGDWRIYYSVCGQRVEIRDISART